MNDEGDFVALRSGFLMCLTAQERKYSSQLFFGKIPR